MKFFLLVVLLHLSLASGLKKKEDPDVYSTTLNIIARHGYPAESYVVTTEDGFLLTLHRIPYSKHAVIDTPGQPIFLQHGLLSSSADNVINGNKSLAFILSDAGYDVWFGNARGNVYSQAHQKYTTSDTEFWDFSWHEMGKYDLPAALTFVGKKTNKTGEIIYIGHSMGTTMFFVYSSLYRNASETVKAMVALAPVAYMSEIKSPIKYVAPWVDDIQWISKYIGLNEFLPSNKLLKILADLGCDIAESEKKLCEDVIFLFAGFDKEEFDERLLPIVLGHTPAGTSTKCFIHYVQEIKNKGNFQNFDYGSSENKRRYGTKDPPFYNMTNIKVPIYLMSAKNDWLSGSQDVEKMSRELPNLISHYVVPMKQFNHIDFLWAKDAPKLVYEPLLKVIKSISLTKGINDV